MRAPPLNRSFPPDRSLISGIVARLEILFGERDNRILMPTLSALSFSSPPTQAECQAMEAKLNEVVKLVAAIVERTNG